MPMTLVRRLFAILIAFSTAPGIATAATCSTPVGCGFNPCKSPSDHVPSSLWGRLQPVDVDGLPSGTFAGQESRDTTWNIRNGSYGLNNPFWQSLDIEDGWLFAGINKGLQIWSLANPRSPDRTSNISTAAIPSLFEAGHHTHQVKDVDAPPGNSNLLTLTGQSAIGMVVWDTNNKFSPRIVYQDGGVSGSKFGEEVYATTIAGRHYGFLAALNHPGSGLWIYDLSRALEVGGSGPCVERRPGTVNPACNGVFLGKLSDAPLNHVDGTGDDASGHLIVFSGGYWGGNGLEIWNVSEPARPALRMTALANRKVHGSALWMRAGRLFLATTLRYPDFGVIYDVSCALSGPCSLPSTPLYRFPLANIDDQTIATVTYSESQGKPFVYFGRRNGHSLSGLQAEWLFDVSDLPSGVPRDVLGGNPNNGNLGQPTTSVVGTTVGYWSWYYACHPSGSNHFEPTDAIFAGKYLYRAGSSILDVHELTDAILPATIFASSFESGDLDEWSAATF
ncbi:MAG: hypothetical protein AAF604_13400 [Acidobacteriota bacterium]